MDAYCYMHWDFLVTIYLSLKAKSRRLIFHCLRPERLSEYHFQMMIILGQLLQLDEELDREMTIGHPPHREEKSRETLIFSRIISRVTQHFKEFYFTF